MDDELERIREEKLRKLMEKFTKKEEASRKPVNLDSKNFDCFIKNNRIVLVDFWANWCMPCRIFAPEFEKLAEELKGRAVLGKVNVDLAPDIAARFNVRGIPTTILFKNGREVKRFIGVQSKDTLKRAISLG